MMALHVCMAKYLQSSHLIMILKRQQWLPCDKDDLLVRYLLFQNVQLCCLKYFYTIAVLSLL